MIIGDKYKIESDNLNVTLYEKAKSKNPGIKAWQAIAFFSNPHTALHHLVTLGVMETKMKDLKTVCEKLDELYPLVNTLKGLPERVE